MSRLADWLADTHGARFEVVRHFLRGFFESDLVTTPGQWMKVAIGMVSVLLSAGLLMVPTFVHRYSCLDIATPTRGCPAVADYHAQYLLLVHTDTLWIVGLAMCVTGLATALHWQSLFPTLRDCLALASLPISALEIFWSKLAAVVLAFAAFALAMNVLPAALLAALVAGRWQEHSWAAQAAATFSAAIAGCVFVFFSMLALQGLLLNLLPPRLFQRVSLFVQAILFTANVAALPFLWSQPTAGWWPPHWFLSLGSALLGGAAPEARYAVYAAAFAPLLAIATYLVSYHRYRRLLIETPVAKPRNTGSDWTARLALRDPREQAMFSFLCKTLTRSRVHRLVLQVSAGLAIAWMIGSGDLGSRDAFPVVAVPLAVSLVLIGGFRYLFAIPSELRANWIFQTAESEGRVSWLRAVDRFVVGCGLLPVYACTVPAAIAVFGLAQAVRATLLGFFLVLVVFEFLFRDWRKAPFTCSYLPGKRPAWQLLLVAFAAVFYIGTAVMLVHAFSAGWVTFAAAFPLLFGGWRWLHRRRTGRWPETALLYDDLPEPAVSSLNIGFERGSLYTPPPPAAPDALAPVPATPFWNSLAEEDREAAPFFHPAGLAEDLRYGLRLLRKNFRLSATVVATLVLGIGMNVSVFTLLNAAAFRARVPHPESFAHISPIRSGPGMSSVGAITADEYTAYRDSAHTMASLAASFRTDVTLENDRSSSARTLLVSCNFFAVYGVDVPRAGRFFRPDECASGAAPVAVLAEEVWRDRYSADPRIVGRTISLDDRPFTIVGVAPARNPARINGIAIWIPYTAQPYLDLGFDPFHNPVAWLWLDGRLRPGVSRSTAEAEFSSLARQLDSRYPGRKTTVLVTDGSFLAMQSIMSRGGVASSKGYWAMLFLITALAMVLLITCANVMTLLLSRAVARRKEIAVRLSLGAPRARLLRMLLIENFLLAATAGGLSVYIAFHVPGLLFQYLESQPAEFPLQPDWRVFTYIFGVAIGAGCLSALAPALESLKVDLTASLKGSAPSGGGVRLHSVLVSAQVALSLALLVAAGMFLQGYWTHFYADPGYETRRVLVAPLHFPAGSQAAVSNLLGEAAVDRLQAIPGVASVSRCNEVPFTASRNLSAKFADRGIETARMLSFQPGAPDFFRTLGIRLLRGREFRPSDQPFGTQPGRAIVSETLAREMSPDRDPVGRTLELLPGSSYEIVGVAKDVTSALTEYPIVYTFDGWSRRQTFLLVRFTGAPAAAAEAVRTAVRQWRPDVLVTPRTLQSRIDDALEETRHVILLILLLGLVAMTLSVAGIYGVVSFTVTQKTRELGIRLALGAQKFDILREVLVAGARPVLLGLFLGLWLALAADGAIRQIFQNMPFQLDAANPGVYLGSALVLAVAALAAMLVPARRGARSDPMTALHYE
jgi:predicted permease